VVTGGGGGIGRETALALARAGATVAVCDVRQAAADTTAQAVKDEGGRASAHPVDVSSAEEMLALVEAVLETHGTVDIVVNNAAIATAPRPTVDVPLETFQRVIGVNLWGVIHGSLLFLPHLLARPEANLVNVASAVALMGVSRTTAYATSKFAVRGFSEALRMELQGTPVQVTVVFPGVTRTQMMANSPIIDDEDRAALQRHLDSSRGTQPARAAARIVAAIRRNRPRVCIGPDAWLADLAVRALPGSHSRWLHTPVERMINRSLGPSRHG
jgi:NAD(P)-dependent dehydrogenase (short-subunit alcohol dehydrogenase family)